MFLLDRFRRLPPAPGLWWYFIEQCRDLWNLISRCLLRLPWLSRETKIETELKSLTPAPAPAPPSRIIYRPVPGSWQRREHPNWPESVFQVPENVPYGTIYYITKGTQISGGATAHVERLPSGHIVKYPKSNPYNRKVEENHRRDMRTEAAVYQRIGQCSYLPRLIDWDPESCCLTLEFLEKGDLATYLRETSCVPIELRKRWTLQAASAVSVLHAADVIHCDVTPRNLMLDKALDLHIADFAGSSVAGSDRTIAAGSRYQPPDWDWNMPAKAADDIFALGSVMYFIMVGEEPYSELLEEDVEKLFREAKYPEVSHLVCGAVIRGCWNGSLETAEQASRCLFSTVAVVQ